MKKIYYSFLFLLLTPFNAFACVGGEESLPLKIFWGIIDWVLIIGAALGIAGTIYGLGLYIAQGFSKDKNKKIFKNKKLIIRRSLLLCVISLLITLAINSVNSMCG